MKVLNKSTLISTSKFQQGGRTIENAKEVSRQTQRPSLSTPYKIDRTNEYNSDVRDNKVDTPNWNTPANIDAIRRDNFAFMLGTNALNEREIPIRRKYTPLEIGTMKMVPGYRPNDETIPIMGGSLNTMVSTKDIVTYNPYRPIPRPYAKGGILCKPKVGKSTSPAGFVPFEKKAPGKPVVK